MLCNEEVVSPTDGRLEDILFSAVKSLDCFLFFLVGWTGATCGKMMSDRLQVWSMNKARKRRLG